MRPRNAPIAAGLLALLLPACGTDTAAPENLSLVGARHAQASAGEVFQLGDFALFMPPAPDGPRGVLIALGGPNTKGFVSGQSFGAPPAVEAALQTVGQSFRGLAAEHRIAILGTSRFARTSLPDGVASDHLILDALRAGED